MQQTSASPAPTCLFLLLTRARILFGAHVHVEALELLHITNLRMNFFCYRLQCAMLVGVHQVDRLNVGVRSLLRMGTPPPTNLSMGSMELPKLPWQECISPNCLIHFCLQLDAQTEQGNQDHVFERIWASLELGVPCR